MMKYLVMENHESHSIVMDEAGIFHRVANMGYEVGDTITEPIFMRSPKRKKKFDWKKVSTIAAIFVCVLLASVPFISSDNESDVIVYMSINPEIHLELNEDGKINKLVADNEDGKVLLDGYKYRGKSVSSVLIELIDRAERLEFLSEGGDIHITVEASDDDKAKKMSVDLSEILKNTHAKKYLVKIRANQEDFHDLNNASNSVDAEDISETEEMTESGYTRRYYEASSHSKATSASTEDAGPTEPAIDDPSENDKETESQQDTSKPTESEPTEAVDPTEGTTGEVGTTEGATEATEPSSGDDSSDEDDEEEWPWWPWPFTEL